MRRQTTNADVCTRTRSGWGSLGQGRDDRSWCIGEATAGPRLTQNSGWQGLLLADLLGDSPVEMAKSVDPAHHGKLVFEVDGIEL